MRIEKFCWALAENLEDWENPLQIKNILRAQELERFGYARDINNNSVIIPQFKDLSFTKEQIQRIVDSVPISHGNRDQLAFHLGYEYVCLFEEYDA